MNKIIPRLLIAGYFSIFIIIIVGLGWAWHTYREAPDQPIAYSHNKHINFVGLECTHCHAYADRALMPGIPPLQTCMECHENVATDRPEIIKLTAYWNKKEPVPWINVNYLPPHVYFTHKRHVKRGFECAECHGDIAHMDKVRQVKSFRMGWCVTCHRANNGPTDCWTCHK
ncbi:cytochrome c3 family protein [candidate division KSB1 bacterium]|nr:cytochrome c3 family protein [candidate division KSB1 bacterium]